MMNISFDFSHWQSFIAPPHWERRMLAKLAFVTRTNLGNRGKVDHPPLYRCKYNQNKT